MEVARAEIRRLHGLPDNVGFTDPGALFAGEADGDGVAGRRERVD